MTEKSIPFKPEMVRAILEGRKTMTRRVLKQQPVPPASEGGKWHIFNRHGGVFCDENEVGKLAVDYCPIAVGDLLWVREEHYRFGHWEPVHGVTTKGGEQKWRFVADGPSVLFEPPPDGYLKAMSRTAPATPAWHKRLARFMPRSLSRITLEVIAVKVERLKDISDEDAKAEGIQSRKIYSAFAPHTVFGVGEGEYHAPSAVSAFRDLWDSINGPGSWDANPWVAAYSFKRVLPK